MFTNLHFLFSIPLQQSLWRRRAAMKLYKPLLKRIKLAKERKKTNAATTIQSAWRGFVVYSEYLIKRYENKAAVTIQAHWRGYWQLTSYSLVYCEIVKVQALVRGHQERSWQDFQKECATIIQAAGRRFLARKEVHNECMVSILIAAAANSLRVRNAAGKIQHWWMAEMWQRREKRAALVIERFFIYVKKEVEKEVKALKKKKKAKRRQRKMKQSDDYILERAWLGVAEEAPMMPVAVPQPQRPMPSQMKAYNNKQDRYSSSRGVIQTVEDDQQSEVSGLTDLDFGRSGGRKMKSQREFEEDGLEAAFRESEAQMSRQKGSSGKKSKPQSKAYSRRYDR